MGFALGGHVEASLLNWLQAHRAELDGLVMDMDGVLILGKVRLPGSLELLDWLRAEHLPFMLLTNDGSRSKAQRSALLARRGLTVPPAQIVTCSDGLLELVAARPELRHHRYFLVGKLGDPCYARAAGLDRVTDLAELDSCAGVIMGEGEHLFDWETTFTALLNYFARHPGAPFIVPNPDEYYAVDGGQLRVGAGGQARFIQQVLAAHATPAEVIYLGKPHGPIYQHVHHELERVAGHAIARHRVLMAGDSLHSDMQGGLNFGYRTALLLTGITTPAKLAAHPVQPELVCAAL
jgi:HAD superfamily hydrolase (TIGR01450 family)